MPAAILTPRVRIMAICDGVRERSKEQGVFHLRGVRQGITAPGLPLVPSPLWLFLLLSSPRAGEFPCYIRVVNDRTGRTIFCGYLQPRPIFAEEGGLLGSRARIRCSFPEEGRYTFQVWFFQEQGQDVLKGEMPFAIAAESV